MEEINSVPASIEQAGERDLKIVWQNGHVSLYPSFYLRKHCRCARCVDELTGDQLLDPNRIRNDITPVHIKSVGRYAIQIDWNDGHNTGIYSFVMLRQICPCQDCQSNV